MIDIFCDTAKILNTKWSGTCHLIYVANLCKERILNVSHQFHQTKNIGHVQLDLVNESLRESEIEIFLKKK